MIRTGLDSVHRHRKKERRCNQEEKANTLKVRLTTRDGREVARRRKAGGDPKSAAEAVMLHRLERATTLGARPPA